VLLEETVGPLTPKQTELLVDARDSAERLLGLIEQLLALARLQRPGGADHKSRVDPKELLHKAADAVRGRADDHHVALEVQADAPVPWVEVDAERMELALGNLLDNAISYTPSGGQVMLSAGVSADGRVELTIRDTGIGIPAEYLPHVFERFFRVPGQSNPTGTGLGLAIVKEVVAAHGGEVTCESRPKEGTTFRLLLPARLEGPGDPASAA
jgi:signal transduction histidine kinase